VKIAFKNEFNKLFFRKMLRLPQNKIVHNFLITSPNRMNQSFTCRQNIVFVKKGIDSIFCNFSFYYPAICILEWGNITFSLSKIKVTFLESSCDFLFLEKVSKIMSKIILGLHNVKVELSSSQ